MGGVDSLPVISQTKSLVQVISGDAEGARKTQENFLQTCPVVSQSVSLGQAIAGDTEGARQRQLKFVESLSDMADGIPVVGHVKGTVHYIAGDREGGDKAMKSSSRTVGVLVGGAGGLLVGGPVGAVAGGIAGGAALDGITTGVDSLIHDEYRPSGTISTITTIAQGKSESVSGDIFDLGFGVVMDGITGYGAGKAVRKMQAKSQTKVQASKTSTSGPQASPTGEGGGSGGSGGGARASTSGPQASSTGGSSGSVSSGSGDGGSGGRTGGTKRARSGKPKSGPKAKAPFKPSAVTGTPDTLFNNMEFSKKISSRALSEMKPADLRAHAPSQFNLSAPKIDHVFKRMIRRAPEIGIHTADHLAQALRGGRTFLQKSGLYVREILGVTTESGKSGFLIFKDLGGGKIQPITFLLGTLEQVMHESASIPNPA